MDNSRYSTVAVALHWAIAILILGQIAGGFYMHNLPNASPIKFDLYQLHKSFGLSVLALSIFRLGWRFTHQPPALPTAMPGWQKLAARGAHWGFYALMILTPLAGWAMVSVSPLDIPTKWFGVVPVPHLPFFDGVADREAVEEMFKARHDLLAKLILVLLALHVGAALKHVFINKDGVFRSMAPATIGQLVGVLAILGALVGGAGFYLLSPTPQANAATPTVDESADANWIVDYDASTLVFIGEEKGRRFEGAFGDFQAVINFDANNLEAARIQVDVATGGASTGEPLRDSTLPGGDWFNVKDYPTASFISEDVRSAGGNAYVADGVLRIKDFEQPATIAFTLTIDGDKAVATGGADLLRTDYGLGLASSWLDEEEVAIAVRIEFEIHAVRSE